VINPPRQEGQWSENPGGLIVEAVIDCQALNKPNASAIYAALLPVSRFTFDDLATFLRPKKGHLPSIPFVVVVQ